MEPFKNAIGPDAVRWLASRISKVSPSFDAKAFTRRSLAGLDELELKPRARHLADALEQTLPADGLEVLIRFLEHADASHSFWLFPVSEFIERHGIEDPEVGLRACAALTVKFTSEFCIRPLIQNAWKPTLKTLQQWVKSENEHLRRLVSEGTRTRLPWGRQLPAFIADPAPVLPLLEKLKDDPSDYVRRSVANNLNDIAKDHPEVTLEIAERWLKGASKERKRLVEHSLRTLLKRGDPKALKLIGAGGALNAKGSMAPLKVKLGDRVTFSATLKNEGPELQHAVVEARVHFVRPKGTSVKPFRIARVDVKPGETVTVSKALELQHRSIRQLYAGDHEVELQVNGVRSPLGKFRLAL